MPKPVPITKACTRSTLPTMKLRLILYEFSQDPLFDLPSAFRCAILLDRVDVAKAIVDHAGLQSELFSGFYTVYACKSARMARLLLPLTAQTRAPLFSCAIKDGDFELLQMLARDPSTSVYTHAASKSSRSSSRRPSSRPLLPMFLRAPARPAQSTFCWIRLLTFRKLTAKNSELPPLFCRQMTPTWPPF